MSDATMSPAKEAAINWSRWRSGSHGLAFAVVGYGSIALASVGWWRRHPFFARTAAVVLGAVVLTQLIDYAF